MEHVVEGNQLFVEELYQDAANAYTKGLSKLMGKDQFNALFGRAKCRIALQSYKLAINDLGECVSLRPNDGLSNFYLGYFMMKENANNGQIVEKCLKYLKIAKANHGDRRIKPAIKEATQMLDKLNQEASKNGKDKKDERVDSSLQSETSTASTASTASKNENEKVKMDEKEQEKTESQKDVKVEKYRDSWYQDAKSVTYTLYVKNLTSNDVKMHFGTDSVEYRLSLPNNKSYHNEMLLSHSIIAQKCTFSVNKYKIVCTLAKENVGFTWKELLREKEKEMEKESSKINAPWTTKKNWDKVDKMASKELDQDKPEGDDALQSLFQKIYADGSDEQKRAMVKSFQTSGGTVLSTNWDDVKKKDYEGKDKVLPTGQDVKKWEY